VQDLSGELDRLAAETRFSGVVRVDSGDGVVLRAAYGLANRAYDVANTVDTRFAIASGTKGLTALTIVSLIEEGRLEPGTTARSVLGADLPLIAEAVTIEDLLGHRSGIGDYLDEEDGHDVDEHLLPVPVHELATTAGYLLLLDGHPPKFPPGERFAYCNSGYVVLALIAERVAGTPFHELVERLCRRAGLHDTAFDRSDELPGRTAVGYLATERLRTNVLHLPVRGSGDGGIYSTVSDIRALWTALFSGRIVSQEWVERMLRPRSHAVTESMRCGLGFWLHESRDDVVMLEGYDAGVSFRTVHDLARDLTHTVVSNTSSGAWPITRALDQLLAL
jgi:CubicO group peptidase (beta-lactamase class C family)